MTARTQIPGAPSAPGGRVPPRNPAARPKYPITVEQWSEVDDELRLELVNGRLERMPDVPLWHDAFLFRFMMFLGEYVMRNGLGDLIPSNGKIKLTRHRGRKPDILFIPKSMMDVVGNNLVHGPPPLVVEVLSPGKRNILRDRRTKRREYQRIGIGQYWIVDFPNRRIEVLELVDGEYREAQVIEGDGPFRPAMFPGLEIPLAQVWPAEYENRPLE